MGTNGRRQKILYLRATRHGSRGGPIKFLAVPGGLSLHNLAEVITEAFDLAFTPSYRFCAHSDDPDRPDVLRPRATHSAEIFDRPGREMLFFYRDGVHREEIRIVVTLVGEEEVPPL